MRGFRMAFEPRDRFQFDFVPADCAGLFVQAKQAPFVPLLLRKRVSIAIEADFQLRLLFRIYSGGNIYPVAPNDRAGMTQARNGRLPQDVASRLEVPGGRTALIRNAARVRSAKLRPING